MYQFKNKQYERQAARMNMTGFISGICSAVSLSMFIMVGIMVNSFSYSTIYALGFLIFGMGWFIFRYMGEHFVMMDKLEQLEAKVHGRSKAHI